MVVFLVWLVFAWSGAITSRYDNSESVVCTVWSRMDGGVCTVTYADVKVLFGVAVGT